MRDDFLIFGAPLIGDEEIDEVVDCLKSGWLGTGPKVSRFESMIAAYKGVNKDQVAAVNSGTAALHVSLIASGIGPGDEVITTPLTFCATVNAIIHSGATPVLADVDPKTQNIYPDSVEAVITPRTRAILPVHFAGRMCDMRSLCQIAQKYDLKIIEDCAHAIESESNGLKAGTIGDFSCFSFYVTKNIITGEGGMIIARKQDNIARVKALSLHGMSKDAWHRFSDSGYKHYYVVECGYKYNMMDIQAAIGIHQLEKVEENWKIRQKIWNHYQLEFKNLPITLPSEPEPDSRHAYHLYNILIDKQLCNITRDSFLNAIQNHNIGVGVHYLSIPEHPYYQEKFGWKPEDYPESMKIGRQTVSLPLSASLSIKDAENVVTAVREIVTGSS